MSATIRLMQDVEVGRVDHIVHHDEAVTAQRVHRGSHRIAGQATGRAVVLGNVDRDHGTSLPFCPGAPVKPRYETSM